MVDRARDRAFSRPRCQNDQERSVDTARVKTYISGHVVIRDKLQMVSRGSVYVHGQNLWDERAPRLVRESLGSRDFEEETRWRWWHRLGPL